MARRPDLSKIPSNATKKQLIERYEQLLDAYKSSAEELAEARKQRTEAAKRQDAEALSVGASASVG